MFEEVRDFLAETMNLKKADIKPESRLTDDLELDSLDAVEMILDLQDRYGVKVSEEQALKFKTVQDLVTFLETHRA